MVARPAAPGSVIVSAVLVTTLMALACSSALGADAHLYTDSLGAPLAVVLGPAGVKLKANPDPGVRQKVIPDAAAADVDTLTAGMKKEFVSQAGAEFTVFTDERSGAQVEHPHSGPRLRVPDPFDARGRGNGGMGDGGMD
jgi:hypothetical protein